MNSTTIAALALIIGLGGGYLIGRTTVPAAPATHTTSHGATMADTMAGMTAGLQGKTGDAFDQAFIQEMIVHHEGAVSMAQQALQQAQHAEIKAMAQDIITAQTREIRTMQDWLQSWYGVQPAAAQ